MKQRQLQNKNGWVLPGMSFPLSQWPIRQARMLILLVETNLPELQTTRTFGTFDPPIAMVPSHCDVILSEDFQWRRI
jgi:hypothetical protein